MRERRAASEMGGGLKDAERDGKRLAGKGWREEGLIHIVGGVFFSVPALNGAAGAWRS